MKINYFGTFVLNSIEIKLLCFLPEILKGNVNMNYVNENDNGTPWADDSYFP